MLPHIYFELKYSHNKGILLIQIKACVFNKTTTFILGITKEEYS